MGCNLCEILKENIEEKERLIESLLTEIIDKADAVEKLSRRTTFLENQIRDRDAFSRLDDMSDLYKK